MCRATLFCWKHAIYFNDQCQIFCLCSVASSEAKDCDWAVSLIHIPIYALVLSTAIKYTLKEFTKCLPIIMTFIICDI